MAKNVSLLNLTSFKDYLALFFILFMPISNVVLEMLNLTSTFFSSWQIFLLFLLIIFSAKSTLSEVASFKVFPVLMLLYISSIILIGLLLSEKNTLLIMWPTYLLYPIFTLSLLKNHIKNFSDKALKLLIISLSILVFGGLLELTSPETVQSYVNRIEGLRLGNVRLTFGVGSSLVYGPVIAIYLTLLFAHLLYGNKSLWKFASLVMMILGIITLYNSFTRIAWIQLILAIGILLLIYFIQSFKNSSYFKIYFVMIFSLGIFSSISYFIFFYKVFLVEGIFQRNLYWENAFNAFINNPFTGQGIGSYTWATREIRGSDVVAESFLLQLLAEMGIVPFIFFSFIFFYIEFRLIKLIIKKSNMNNWTIYAIFAVLTSFLVNLIGSQAMNAYILSFLYWIFIILAYSSMKRE